MTVTDFRKVESDYVDSSCTHGGVLSGKNKKKKYNNSCPRVFTVRNKAINTSRALCALHDIILLLWYYNETATTLLRKCVLRNKHGRLRYIIGTARHPFSRYIRLKNVLSNRKTKKKGKKTAARRVR